jgi:membrane-associated protein
MLEAFEFFRHIINPQWIFDNGGIWLLLIVVFAETGLFVGFFFPGDSLLFITGLSLANKGIAVYGDTSIGVVPVIILLIIAGILGNSVGYWFGKKSGPMLFNRKDSFFFKQKHLTKAKEFYDNNGAMAIIFARFLPFIRTFAPIVAGIVSMDKKRFTLYNIVGCIAWVTIMILAGYFLGQQFPVLRDHLELIVIVIIVITTAPVLIKFLGGKSSTKNG